jgi:hypothetical protein
MEQTLSGVKNNFHTPKKPLMELIKTRGTNGDFPTSAGGSSFEKNLNSQLNGYRYTTMNINELLGSDVKYKSPSQLMLMDMHTPVRSGKSGEKTEANQEAIDSGYKISKATCRQEYREPQLNLSQLALDASKPYPQSFWVPERRVLYQETTYERREETGIYGSPESEWDESDSKNEDIRKRRRKNNAQLKILKSEYKEGDCWSKEKISALSRITGLSESQVYKWCWDQKKKKEEGVKNKENYQVSFNVNLYKRFETELHIEEQSNLNKRAPPRMAFNTVNDYRL